MMNRNQEVRYLTLNPNAVPEQLRTLNQWVLWRFVWRDGKPTKPPFTLADLKKPCNPHDPASWLTFAQAVEAVQTHRRLNGVGLVLRFENQLVALDLDHCVTRDGDQWTVADWAWAIVKRFDTYTEVSPSGHGLRLFVRGRLPGHGRRKGPIETYDHERYVTLTGARLPQAPTTVEDRQDDLTAWHRELFGPPRRTPIGSVQPTWTPDGGELTPLTDKELRILGEARRAKHGDVFAKLWDGEGDDDRSKGDFRLVYRLIYWFGTDPAVLDRQFRHSKRMRNKWDERRGAHSYGVNTIEAALQKKREQPLPAPPTDAEHHPVTDLGNVWRLMEDHADVLRYTPTMGWVHFTGQRWARDLEDAHVLECAKDTVRHIKDEAALAHTEAARAQLLNWAERSQNKTRLCNMVFLARSEPAVLVQREQLDADRSVLNTPTATLHLQTGETWAHRAEDLLTKMTGVAYDPAATCPKWEALVHRVFAGDPVMITFLQRLAGCCLTGTALRRIVFFWGDGDNGKTTILEVFRGVLGDYALQTPMSTLMAKRDGGGIPNDVARFPGSRLITAVESEHGQRFAEALVKYLTGGDRQIARFLFKEFFEFEPSYKLVIASNNKPEIKGTDNAIWNRICLVPFLQVIPRSEQIEKYHEQLVATEGPGILNWMLAGCDAYQQEGLGVPEAVQAATASYRAEMNRLGDFLSDCCELVPGASARVGDLYQTYKYWCEKGNEEALSQTAFGRELSGRGFPEHPTARSPRCRVGLRLKEGWQRYAEGRRQWADAETVRRTPVPSPVDLSKEILGEPEPGGQP
jgi:putative DNA primase/helicase